MKYLVASNVLSEPTKPTPDPGVVAWLRAHEPDTAVDAQCIVLPGEDPPPAGSSEVHARVRAPLVFPGKGAGAGILTW